MDLKIFYAILFILYMYLMCESKIKRKINIFMSKSLNLILLLILIIIFYLEDKNFGTILLILLIFSKQITSS